MSSMTTASFPPLHPPHQHLRHPLSSLAPLAHAAAVPTATAVTHHQAMQTPTPAPPAAHPAPPPLPPPAPPFLLPMTRQVTALCLSSSALSDARSSSLSLLSSHIQHHHTPSRTLLINLSERPYPDDERLLHSCSVLTFNFPGLPSPPLSLLLVIASAIARWVDADALHHAFIHCQLGLGRTLLTLVALLVYTASVDDVSEAESYVQQRMRTPQPLRLLLLPSQRRYLDYLHQITKGHPPTPQRAHVERVIVHGIPACEEREAGGGEWGCRPYLQLFDATGRLLHSSPGTDSLLRFHSTRDDSILFHLPPSLELQGDVLFRLRHLSLYPGPGRAARSSIARWQVHVGYLEGSANVLRLERAELDGADRADPHTIPTHFLVDIVLTTTPTDSNGLSSQQYAQSTHSTRSLSHHTDAAGEGGKDSADVAALVWQQWKAYSGDGQGREKRWRKTQLLSASPPSTPPSPSCIATATATSSAQSQSRQRGSDGHPVTPRFTLFGEEEQEDDEEEQHTAVGRIAAHSSAHQQSDDASSHESAPSAASAPAQKPPSPALSPLSEADAAVLEAVAALPRRTSQQRRRALSEEDSTDEDEEEEKEMDGSGERQAVPRAVGGGGGRMSEEELRRLEWEVAHGLSSDEEEDEGEEKGGG